MPDVGALCTDISVVFASSSTLRSVLPRLSDVLVPHLPLVEVEAVWLLPTEDSVVIEAVAPAVERRWTGQRSARYLERKAVQEPVWIDDGDPARVAFTPVDLRLIVPVGSMGLLSVGFSTEIQMIEVESKGTDIWVNVLAGQCRRLGQLSATARIARQAHRKLGDLEERIDTLLTKLNTEISRSPSESSVARSITEIPVKAPSDVSTEIPVKTIEDAMVECISRALRATHGRIYGDRGAAELLGLKPSTLQSKMRKLGIERQAFTAD